MPVKFGFKKWPKMLPKKCCQKMLSTIEECEEEYFVYFSSKISNKTRRWNMKTEKSSSLDFQLVTEMVHKTSETHTHTHIYIHTHTYSLSLSVCVCVWEREKESDREEIEGERDIVLLCAGVWERERERERDRYGESVCVCVCVREREREREFLRAHWIEDTCCVVVECVKRRILL